MPTKKDVIWVYVTSEEHQMIMDSAAKSGLSLSTFAKRVCLGIHVESKVDSRAVLDLVKVNADMGRVGGLLKLWLTEPDKHAYDARKLLHELMILKDQLAARIKNLGSSCIIY
jgi:hypothetical protein